MPGRNGTRSDQRKHQPLPGAGSYLYRPPDRYDHRAGCHTDLIISSYEKKGPRSFAELSQPETNRSNGCLRWLAIGPQGYPVIGMDYFELDSDHRITGIVGFF
ncbi:hypothetical protein IEE83_17640 [Dyadobacter sp. UP-52]|uniref:Uncharacterized protein n=2 Tax=Dyadobacter subterraneus TaxID=2773304 RepID=A0ABR9WDZ0_9BACT|nr:hypothetical protein [Dyadobacter subterraneus]